MDTNDNRLAGLPLTRRQFMKNLGWAGSGLLFAVNGGVPRCFNLAEAGNAGVLSEAVRDSSFSFVHLSDSHIGFNREPNHDVLQTLNAAISKINSADAKPEILLHTGDFTHNSLPEEFDAFESTMKSAKVDSRLYIPGEHDVRDITGHNYRSRFGSGTKGDGWYSLNHKGVHFVGLINVMNFKPGKMGELGLAQLEWLEKDLEGLSSSTPLVIFSHIPLLPIYPEWGWGTSDGDRAIAMFRKFGSVTVLNGHIHQSMQKTEGNLTFHSSCSTSYPLPYPGSAKSPEPSAVAANTLRSLLGLTTLIYFDHETRLAVIDSSLRGTDLG